MKFIEKNKEDLNLESASREALITALSRTQALCERLDEIIEYAPDGIYITDGDANAIRINLAFERISGLKRSNLLGRNHRDLEKKGIIGKSCALIAIEKRSTVTIIHEYLTTNRQALDTCTPIFDDQGNISMTVSSIRDLTELNDLRNELSQEKMLRQQYERRLEEIQNQINLDSEFIAKDKSMLNTLSLANRMARVDSTVLITGETGTGKDVIAHYIHQNGMRKEHPFIAVNCGAIPENLVESELFGYEKGAFTGADQKGKAGLIEAADHGTLFLDEIGELPLHVQAKLLRSIQGKTVIRVGGTKETPIDIRIIAATNKDLAKMVKDRTFREDLFYRISVVPIWIPPLRERKDDIIPLINFFLDKINKQYQLNRTLTQMAYRILLEYQWPGNVRELKNLIERIVVTSEEERISANALPMYQPLNAAATLPENPLNLKERLERYEYSIMQEAFDCHRNVRAAAKYLGMSEPTFVRKRKQYREKFDS